MQCSARPKWPTVTETILGDFLFFSFLCPSVTDRLWQTRHMGFINPLLWSAPNVARSGCGAGWPLAPGRGPHPSHWPTMANNYRQTDTEKQTGNMATSKLALRYFCLLKTLLTMLHKAQLRGWYWVTWCLALSPCNTATMSPQAIPMPHRCYHGHDNIISFSRYILKKLPNCFPKSLGNEFW